MISHRLFLTAGRPLAVGMLLLSAAACAGCAVLPLSAESIDSQIVDADTGAPIEGAIIDAFWTLRPGSQGFPSSICGSTKAEEAVTDQDGRFHLAGWGPTPPGCGGKLHGADPLMYVFKPGYHFGSFANDLSGLDATLMTGNAWKGRQMKLKAFSDAELRQLQPDVYRDDFRQLNTALGTFTTFEPTECNWKRMPNMLRALALQEQSFNDTGRDYHGVISALIANDQWYQEEAPRCGSPKSFIEGLLK